MWCAAAFPGACRPTICRRAPPRGRAARASRAGKLFGSITAALAVALLAGLLVSHIRGRGAHTTSATLTATRTIPARGVSWHGITVPAAASGQDAYSTIGVAPESGDTAYLCSLVGNSGAPRVWLTQDEGHTWAPVADVPAIVSGAARLARCFITVAAGNQLTAIAAVESGIPMSAGAISQARYQDFLTSDGGEHWQRMPIALDLNELSYIAHGYLLALAGDQPAHLLLSTGSFRVWTPVDSPIITAGEHIIQFWANPISGEVLATAQDAKGLLTIWHATLPASGEWQRERSSLALVTAAPAAPTGFTVCATPGAIVGGGMTELPGIACSHDSGQTWELGPSLTFTGPCHLIGCKVSGSPTETDGPLTLALAGNGTLLALLPQAGTLNVALFELAPGSAGWTRLATAHGVLGAIAAPDSVGEALWEGTTPPWWIYLSPEPQPSELVAKVPIG